MKKLFIINLFLFGLLACNNAPATVEKETTKDNGEPDLPHTSAEWKIWALSTAAPSFIAANCTVIDSDGKTILREGTNGWTAMAGNPRGMSDPENGWKDPHEAMPMVMDAQGMKDLSFGIGKDFNKIILVFASRKTGKPLISCYVSKQLVKEEGRDASQIIKHLGQFIDGGGGGQSFFATAGGKKIEGINLALDEAKKILFSGN